MSIRHNSRNKGIRLRNSTLTANHRPKRHLHQRKLGLELLEDRRLLSIDSPQLEMFGVSPALFVENQGQWADSSIRYLHQGNGANVAMTDAGLEFQVFRQEENPGSPLTIDLQSSPEEGPLLNTAQIESLQFSARFAGANEVTPIGIEQAETLFNYLVGERANWHSAVPSYRAVSYENLYPGIELKTWGQRDSLKYEFHVAPGADYKQIQVHYSGIDGLSLADNGSLLVDLGEGWGELTDDAPYIYQVIDGKQTAVAGQFHLIDAQTYTFTVTGAFDAAHELVIDPDLAWATYLGGSGSDYGNGISADATGNAYVTGYTSSANFSGASNTFRGGSNDAFVAKISTTGTLLWATYLGGSGADYAYGIFVDAEGNAFVTGNTASADFSGANNSYIGGTSDAFAAKLSPTGSLVWATYLGGGKVETGYGISIDTTGNAFVTGSTTSTNFISANNGFKSGNSDAFLAKVSSTGAIVWATYLGGTGTDVGRGISMDASGNAIVTGNTASTSLPSANNTFRGGAYDAFVMQVSTTGVLVWATFLGGSGDDYGYGICVDSSNNVFAAGNTSSTDFTGKNNSFMGGNHDAFAVKLSTTGTLAWAIYLGGNSNDVGYGISVDAAGNAFVAGDTSSSNFSGVNNAFKGGNSDVFAVKVSTSGTLAWATYLGGNYVDAGRSIFMDALGDIFVTGQTTSTNFSGANNTTKGSIDVFVAKLFDRSQTPSTPVLAAASDTGASNSDKITNLDNSATEKTLQFTVGNTISGTPVSIYADGIVIGSATADGTTTTVTTNGTFDLLDGTHLITARQTEPGQPESQDSPALNLVIDTEAPAPPDPPDLQAASDNGASNNDNITNDKTPTFDIPTGPYFRFFREGTRVSGNYEPGSTYTAASQTDGTYHYTITAVDAAGNASAQSGSLAVTIDTQSPSPLAAPILQAASDSGASNSDNITNIITPTFDIPTTLYFKFYRDAACISGPSETGSTYTAPAQTDGTFHYTITAVDMAGNESAQSGSLDVTIDTQSPSPLAAPILQAASDSGTSNTDNITNVITPTFDIPATSNFRFYCDGMCISMHIETGLTYTTSVLADGTHIFTVTTMDIAGNESAQSDSLAVTIDTAAPTVVINQAQRQSDPTGSVPVKFTVSFNETVVDFMAGDVIVSGTAGATNALVTGSGKTYSVSVSDMASNGTVNVTLPAAVAYDLAGNASIASTSTDNLVNYDTTTLIWDGGGTDDNWSTPANWVGDIAPLPGNNLVFPDGAARLDNINDFPPDTVFSSIVITGGDYHFQNDFNKSSTVQVQGNATLSAVSINCDTLTIGTSHQPGQTRTWSGGGTDNFWSTATNWIGDEAPLPGDKLVFPAGALRLDNLNDFPTDTVFESIAVSGGNYHFLNNVFQSPSIAVLGNAVLTASSIICDTLAIGTPHQPGQTRTWSGGGTDNLWSTAANWIGDEVPLPGDKLVFPAGALRLDNLNDYPTDTVFGSIAVSGGNYHFLNNAIQSSTVIVQGHTVLTTASIICDTLTIGTSSAAISNAAAIAADSPRTDAIVLSAQDTDRQAAMARTAIESESIVNRITNHAKSIIAEAVSPVLCAAARSGGATPIDDARFRNEAVPAEVTEKPLATAPFTALQAEGMQSQGRAMLPPSQYTENRLTMHRSGTEGVSLSHPEVGIEVVIAPLEPRALGHAFFSQNSFGGRQIDSMYDEMADNLSTAKNLPTPETMETNNVRRLALKSITTDYRLNIAEEDDISEWIAIKLTGKQEKIARKAEEIFPWNLAAISFQN